jgi:CheY-like chemotaxis protein
VLVVDDDPGVLEALGELLAELGAEPVLARGAAEALRRLAEAPADLAVIDVDMPGMNGLELTRTLRLRWAGLPVLLMSGRDYGAEAAEGGAIGFLLKPLSLEELSRWVGPRPAPGAGGGERHDG